MDVFFVDYTNQVTIADSQLLLKSTSTQQNRLSPITQKKKDKGRKRKKRRTKKKIKETKEEEVPQEEMTVRTAGLLGIE